MAVAGFSIGPKEVLRCPFANECKVYTVGSRPIVVWATVSHTMQGVTLSRNLLLFDHVAKGYNERSATEIVAGPYHWGDHTQVCAKPRKQICLG